MDLISVIVPIYNVEKYLRRCVDSIIAQTYSNLEIILVDDGSPDNCPAICDEYAKKDSRVRVIHQKNGGLSAARNAGLDAASGDYIGFVDSDDYIALNMYEKLYNTLRNNSADLAICSIECVDGSGNPLNLYSQISDNFLKNNDIMKILCEKDIVNYITAVNRLYKKDLFKTLRFDTGKTNEDEFIAHKIYAQCKTVVTISSPLYFYVQRNDSIMGMPLTINRADGIEGIYNRLQFLKSNYPEVDLCQASQHLFNTYRYLKVRFNPQKNEEFKRMEEIDRMAFEIYSLTKPRCGWKNVLFFEAKPIYTTLFKIKNLFKREET